MRGERAQQPELRESKKQWMDTPVGRRLGLALSLTAAMMSRTEQLDGYSISGQQDVADEIDTDTGGNSVDDSQREANRALAEDARKLGTIIAGLPKMYQTHPEAFDTDVDPTDEELTEWDQMVRDMSDMRRNATQIDRMSELEDADLSVSNEYILENIKQMAGSMSPAEEAAATALLGQVEYQRGADGEISVFLVSDEGSFSHTFLPELIEDEEGVAHLAVASIGDNGEVSLPVGEEIVTEHVQDAYKQEIEQYVAEQVLSLIDRE